jgi:IS5 family transposase
MHQSIWHQRDKKRKRCQRRAAIEPSIGHLKSDYRVGRNYLKGIKGDEINLLMAACAWNLNKWMKAILLFIFSLNFRGKIRVRVLIFTFPIDFGK